MKKSVFRYLAFALVAAFCLGAAAPAAYAEEAGSILPVYEEDRTAGNRTETISASVELVITAGIPVQANQRFAVSLTGPENRSAEAVLASTDENAADQTRVCFEDLTAGSYHLSVASDGYMTFGQDIEIGQYDCKIQLYAGLAEGFGAAAHPGLLVAGDFNGDGRLNEADRDMLVDAMSQEQYVEVCDINRDGQVDMVDLQYFTRYFGEAPAVDSTPELRIPAGAVIPGLGAGTRLADGSLEEMLEGEGTVRLSTASGAAIDTSNPVEIGFDFLGDGEIDGFVIQAPKDPANGIAEAAMTVEYEDEDGTTQAVQIALSRQQAGTARLMAAVGGTAERNADGTIEVKLAGKVAVKRILIRVTATATPEGTLAEISQVEFLNNMDSRIPAPTMDIPSDLTAEAGNKQIHLLWKKSVNVLGYEIAVTYEGVTETHRTTKTSYTVSSFQNRKLKNNESYEIAVRAVNGDWRSPYCASVTAVPKTDKKPDAPTGVQVEGAYCALIVRWNAPEDTDTCNLYYKEEGEDSFRKAEGIEGSQYRIGGLKDNTKYLLYVTGVNEMGEGASSELTEGSTISLQPVEFPQYRIITAITEEGQPLEHVRSASKCRGEMVNSPLDENGNSALGLVDGSFSSYFFIDDWNEAADYGAQSQGVIVELDQEYTMDRIAFAAPDNTYSYRSVRVFYKEADGQEAEAAPVSLLQRRDGNNRIYYVIKLARPVTTSQVRLGFSRYVRGIAVSELRFYEYDSLEADIQALYQDELHLTLRDDVTKDVLDALYARLDERQNGELHPDRELLKQELDEAKLLFETQGELGGVVTIEPAISDKQDGRISVGGLNSWQPIGVSALAGEEIIIYVGHPDKKAGSTSDLYLIGSQYYAPASNLAGRAIPLKVGRNVISCEQLIDAAREKGGSLYVEYRGASPDDAYAVRASGSVKIPVLNLYHVTDETERRSRIEAYVWELENYVNNLEALHASAHKNSGYAYKSQECVANTTEIMLDTMLLSLPATQVYGALGSDPASVLDASTTAMDGMMTLFYQHKGLTDRFAADTPESVKEYNHLPARHLNIRYMYMTTAFMYAAGNHIGIRWNETRGAVSQAGPQVDENGRKISGQYFGWGLAHEIGHNINQGCYAVAEVTNNYFSVLAQAADTNGSVRFKYADVYRKVTSGTTGRDGNVFTQLGLYWQLHLAYDKGYNYRLYGDYNEIFENLFFARVDSYARNTAAAPSPGGIKLTLDKDTDQNLMRLASAAAERDLTEFFTRWGMTPDSVTRRYMGQFPAETRAIYYACDDARVYVLENGGSSGTDGTFLDRQIISEVQLTPQGDSGEVRMSIRGNADAGVLLGYEITRVTMGQGREKREVAGFTTTGDFTDQISYLGSRAVRYEVTAVDQFLNRSAVYETAGFKASGSGILDKSGWTVTTNMTSPADRTQEAGEGEGQLCEPVAVPAAGRIIDGDAATVYTGSAAGEEPYILLCLNRLEEVCGLRYTRGAGTGIGRYRIEVSADGQSYQTVKADEFRFDEAGEALFYFTNQDAEGAEDKDPRIAIYDAAYVKITAVGQAGADLSAAEIDLLAPSGDNVEFYAAGEGEAIGILAEDYVYQSSDGASIPAGSLVFTGTYKGNPAYSVVVLYDGQGNIVGGTDSEGALTAEQIILAPDPGDAMLGDISDGTFIYWIAPDKLDAVPAQVRAELYRVDNALTNEGQRLVSDTLFVQMKPLEQLPKIHLTGGAVSGQ